MFITFITKYVVKKIIFSIFSLTIEENNSAKILLAAFLLHCLLIFYAPVTTEQFSFSSIYSSVVNMFIKYCLIYFINSVI